jgi:hypothetical protein
MLQIALFFMVILFLRCVLEVVDLYIKHSNKDNTKSVAPNDEEKEETQPEEEEETEEGVKRTFSGLRQDGI